jgi:holin-like protein
MPGPCPMLKALTVLLLFQLAGETLTRALSLPIPGPVMGMTLLLVALILRTRGQADLAPEWLSTTADGVLRHLSLLFVPAGVGLIAHLGRLQDEWLPIGAALVVSTIASIAVGAAVFVGVARLTGARAAGDEAKSDALNTDGGAAP